MKHTKIQPIVHPQLTYSDYVDNVPKKTVLEALDDSPYLPEFIKAVKDVLNRLKSYETVDVHWWGYPFIYIDVRDTRWKHYPCGHRFLVSFDITNGKLDSTESDNRYAFARKGWKKAAREIIGHDVAEYTDCGQMDKTTYC